MLFVEVESSRRVDSRHSLDEMRFGRLSTCARSSPRTLYKK